MKAKWEDTVIKKLPEVPMSLERVRRDRLAQAEISFKAGIRKVVEWIDANVHWRTDAPYKSTIDPDEWQAQKKKWGI